LFNNFAAQFLGCSTKQRYNSPSCTQPLPSSPSFHSPPFPTPQTSSSRPRTATSTVTSTTQASASASGAPSKAAPTITRACSSAPVAAIRFQPLGQPSASSLLRKARGFGFRRDRIVRNPRWRGAGFIVRGRRIGVGGSRIRRIVCILIVRWGSDGWIRCFGRRSVDCSTVMKYNIVT
jgi:hypothetical protein